MSNEPNPFDPDGLPPWQRIYHGGVLCRAGLTKVNGVETKDTWNEQASKETSGKVYVFAGTVRGKPKLTYLCTTRDDYRWLQEHWEMLKPVPNRGGGGGPVAPTGGTQYAAPAQKKPTAVGSPPAPITAANFDIPDNAPAKVPNVGPKPPTISVEYPSLLRHGITALARSQWTDIGFTETNGYEVEIEYVPQDPPRLAGSGALAPPGQQFAGAAQARDANGNPVTPGGGASGSGTGSPAAAQAAGT